MNDLTGFEHLHPVEELLVGIVLGDNGGETFWIIDSWECQQVTGVIGSHYFAS